MQICLLSFENLPASSSQGLYDLLLGGAKGKTAILFDLLAQRSQIPTPVSLFTGCSSELGDYCDGLGMLFLGQRLELGIQAGGQADSHQRGIHSIPPGWSIAAPRGPRQLMNSLPDCEPCSWPAQTAWSGRLLTTSASGWKMKA